MLHCLDTSWSMSQFTSIVSPPGLRWGPQGADSRSLSHQPTTGSSTWFFTCLSAKLAAMPLAAGRHSPPNPNPNPLCLSYFATLWFHLPFDWFYKWNKCKARAGNHWPWDFVQAHQVLNWCLNEEHRTCIHPEHGRYLHFVRRWTKNDKGGHNTKISKQPGSCCIVNVSLSNARTK